MENLKQMKNQRIKIERNKNTMKITLGKKKLMKNVNEINANMQTQALTTQSNEDVQKTEIIELRGRNRRIYSCGVNKTLAE